MAIVSYTMGPGELFLGTADALDVSCQVKAFRVNCKEAVTKTAPQPMLCGEDKVTADKVVREWDVAGKLLQDLTAAAVVDYTWTNAGDTVPFRFVPSTAHGRQVTGVVRLIPISVGGDSGSDPDSDIAWVAGGDVDELGAISGDPILAVAT